MLRQVHTREELERYVVELPNIDKGIVVQEFIQGRDEEILSFHGYFNANGDPLGCFAGKKLRTNPIHFGGSAFVETIDRPDYVQFGIDVCRKIRLKGIVKMDCKRDQLTGQYKILEFNPRFNLWEYLGAFAGINLPEMWYNDLLGNRVEPHMVYTAGRRWVCVAGDLRALPAYLKTREWTLKQWVQTYAKPKVYHTFAWRDPWPIAFAFPHFLIRKYRRFMLKHEQALE